MNQMLKMGMPEAPYYAHDIAYAASKTANVLHAVQLNKLLNKEGIAAFSANPGMALSNTVKKTMERLGKEVADSLGWKKNIDQGAATTLVAALDPKLAENTKETVLLSDCQVWGDEIPGWARDEKAAERLWKLSEEIVEGVAGK
ncbi:hypothetical protein CC80DRAFT_546461 [Byssothecium circinans]|uniref:NAD(P)-binding protein n=1 Tax=Byssothecium circinans TaxID=147558 RepID=A0A6A5U0U1_9PLEO|nr:hypothetical protein CC80DRAFT_546461 [Byssothecium circinans]